MRVTSAFAAGLLIFSGCTSADVPREAASAETARIESSCIARARGQTRTEVVEETVEVAPEKRDVTGRILSEAVFRTRAAPREIEIAPGETFDAICQSDLSDGFVRNLQRALSVRNLYSGPVDGIYNQQTAAAVRALQSSRGLESEILSTDLARMLGLITVQQRN